MSNQRTQVRPDRLAETPLSNRREEQREASRNTQAEFDHLLEAMHRLEAALGSPAPFREPLWANRASRELAEVRKSLESHILSSERSGGLLEELNLASPRVAERVDALRQEHSQLLERFTRLERSLAPSDSQAPDFTSLRREADALLTALRRHHALEVDLIFECFWTDIGVGD
jgi:hypothetical protein